jgi:hypothetical protein
MPLHLQVCSTAEVAAAACASAVHQLIDVCFPEDADADNAQPSPAATATSASASASACASVDAKKSEADRFNALLERLIGFHEPDQCVWLLLWATAPTSSSSSSTLIGLVTLAPYHNSAFICNLCVHPQRRRRGWARFLLLSAQRVVTERWPHVRRLSGSVVRERKDLIAFYTNLGAQEVVQDSAGSDPTQKYALLPPSVSLWFMLAN